MRNCCRIVEAFEKMALNGVIARWETADGKEVWDCAEEIIPPQPCTHRIGELVVVVTSQHPLMINVD